MYVFCADKNLKILLYPDKFSKVQPLCSCGEVKLTGWTPALTCKSSHTAKFIRIECCLNRHSLGSSIISEYNDIQTELKISKSRTIIDDCKKLINMKFD